MRRLLEMKIKYVLLLIPILLLLSLGFVWYMIEDTEFDVHHFVVSKEKLHEETVEGIPDEWDEDEIIYEGMEDRLTELDDGAMHDFEVDRVVPPVIKAAEFAEKNNLPIIIWWTPFTGDMERIKEGEEGRCLFTSDKIYLNHSLTQAFLFYGTDFQEDNIPLPRQSHHEWAVLHEESPKNQALFYHKDTLELFNYTSTFKQQSDYPISTQYVKSASYILHPLNYTVQEKNQIKIDKNLASVVYIQTGCNPPSDRDAYVQELMKYIKIDSYGKCLHNRDLPDQYKSSMKMHNKGFIALLQQYKFIISFENGICNDYMTEKLWRTLNVGAIPIYKGAPNIREWLPDENSAIIASDYSSPKELADYIKFVDNNDKEYLKYLRYKKSGITNSKLNDTLNNRKWGIDTFYKMSFVTGFEVHVCDQIHNNRKLIAQGKDPVKHQATADHYGCPMPKQYKLPPIVGSEDWERETWGWEYNDAVDRARKLRDKVYRSVG